MTPLVTSAVLAFSLAALAHFGLFYWRSLVGQVAANELSDRVREVGLGGVSVAQPRPEDFAVVAALCEICPALDASGNGMGSVRTYYRAMRALAAVTSRVWPAATAWATEEMGTCCRYAAVRLDQRLERNMAHLVDLRSY